MSRTVRHLLVALTLPVLLGATACGGTTEPTSATRIALQHAEAQWSAAGIHDYDYDLVTDHLGQHDSVQVQVRNDQLTLSTSYLSGEASPAGGTMPELFAAVDDAISSGLYVEVTYDPQLGYPALGSVSAQLDSPAGPSTWEIYNFARVP